MARIKAVGNLRKVWPREEHLSDWLLERGLADLILPAGVDAAGGVRHREKRVRDKRCDITFTFEGGRAAHVEVQFGLSDHVHMGQVMTYALQPGVAGVTWLANRFGEAHVAACRSLVEKGVASVRLVRFSHEGDDVVFREVPSDAVVAKAPRDELERETVRPRAARGDKWRPLAIAILASVDCPNFLSFFDIGEAVSSAGGNGISHGRPTMTARRFMDDLVNAGDLAKLKRDLYLNGLKRPLPNPAQAASIIRPGAIVSLHTVLEESLILNFPSRCIYAIVPNSTGQGLSHKREFYGDVAGYHFLTMSSSRFNRGKYEDKLDSLSSYLRATPERALADWLYLVARRQGNGLKPFVENKGAFNEPPPLDLDLSRLDMDRLHRCAEDLRVTESLRAYLARKATHDRGLAASRGVDFPLTLSGEGASIRGQGPGKTRGAGL